MEARSLMILHGELERLRSSHGLRHLTMTFTAGDPSGEDPNPISCIVNFQSQHRLDDEIFTVGHRVVIDDMRATSANVIDYCTRQLAKEIEEAIKEKKARH